MAWSQPICQIIEEIKQAQAEDLVLGKLLEGEFPTDDLTDKVRRRHSIYGR